MKFDYKRLIKFEHNVNEKEKQLRLIAGGISIVISLFLANILLLLIGLLLVTSGYIGWCPAYSALDRPLCTTDTPPAESAAETTTEEKSAETK